MPSTSTAFGTCVLRNAVGVSTAVRLSTDDYTVRIVSEVAVAAAIAGVLWYAYRVGRTS